MLHFAVMLLICLVVINLAQRLSLQQRAFTLPDWGTSQDGGKSAFELLAIYISRKLTVKASLQSELSTGERCFPSGASKELCHNLQIRNLC